MPLGPDTADPVVQHTALPLPADHIPRMDGTPSDTPVASLEDTSGAPITSHGAGGPGKMKVPRALAHLNPHNTPGAEELRPSRRPNSQDLSI